MGKPSKGVANRSKLALRAAAGLVLGASASGCALALAAASQVQLYSRDSVTLHGWVSMPGQTSVKVGLLRYFEGDDSSGSFSLPTDPSGKLAFTTVVVPSSDASHTFLIQASSTHKVADFLLLCWSDSQGAGALTPGELRSPESYLIYKVGPSFSVAEASADQVVPDATPVLGTWPDASKLLFRFDLPVATSGP